MSNDPRLTLFALPKPMIGDARRLQRNAFSSWARLRPEIEVFLLGDETGIREAADEFGFHHLADLRRNQWGTPLLHDGFARIRERSRTSLLGYVNADILFGRDLVSAIGNLQRMTSNRFLAIGQRWESELQQDVTTWEAERLEQWIGSQRGQVPVASVVCKDYFLFPRHLYQELPAFAVGRGNWDNWMVYQAHRQGHPVVDLSAHVTAVHQPHQHQHSGGRIKAYVSGPEARENQRLAGGRHLVVGSHASHRMDAQGRIARMGWHLPGRVISDIPRFLQLLSSFRNVPVTTARVPGESSSQVDV